MRTVEKLLAFWTLTIAAAMVVFLTPWVTWFPTLNKGDPSGWFQALGSVAGIFTAVIVPAAQHRWSTKRERSKAEEQVRHRLNIVLAMLESVDDACCDIEFTLINTGNPQVRTSTVKVLIERAANMVESIPPFDVPDVELAAHLFELRHKMGFALSQNMGDLTYIVVAKDLSSLCRQILMAARSRRDVKALRTGAHHTVRSAQGDGTGEP